MINIFIPRHQSTEACVGAVQEVQEVQETLLAGGAGGAGDSAGRRKGTNL